MKNNFYFERFLAYYMVLKRKMLIGLIANSQLVFNLNQFASKMMQNSQG